MVMEAPPSPQSVGREFVRQYYTLLNKAPTHLHRFYNNQSSFVHGGLDPPNRETSPMIGQKQIHQRIQQLNFRDCHAKITQVDAQATLGNGVVVQVTGELSNAGQPMRRFTQTFVLAAQSPKKYYVHNDIFRYQDEIVSDDECEPECRSETEDDMVQERPVMNEIPQLTQQQPMSYYNPNQAPLQPNLTPLLHHHGQPPSNLTHVIPTPPVASVNGSAHPDDMNIIAGGPVPQHVPPMQPPTMPSPMGNLQPCLQSLSPLMPAEDSQPLVAESPIDSTLETNYNMADDTLDMQELNQDSVLSNEPKTYATLLKSSGSPYGNIPPMSNVYNPPLRSCSPPMLQNRYENRDPQLQTPQSSNQMPGPMGQRMGGGNRGPMPRNNNQQTRPPRQESRTTSGKNSFSEEGISNYDERKKSQGYGNNTFLGGGGGDSNQLFLGNLPHIATEDELREIFAPFGTIVDLRIHSKPGIKGGPIGPRAPPNYGFITYDNQQAVQECLAARPIRYPLNDIDGTVLNVEEKKTKDRMGYMGGGNRGGLDNGGPRNRDNGPRRGPGIVRNNGGPPVGGGGSGNTGRPNNFNRLPPNRNSNNTFNNRR